MCHLLTLASPDDELRGIGEIAARDVGRRVCLGPCYHVQNLIPQMRQGIGHGEDVMVCSRNPNRAILLQFIPAKRQPFDVEVVYILLRHALVPVALVHADHLSTLHAYASTRQEIRRVGKYHVELKRELRKQFKRIAAEQVKVVIGGFEKGGYHGLIPKCELTVSKNDG